MTDKLRFLLDGRVESLKNFDPTLTLLDWLRGEAGRMGTKEGCAEGDCGACTVLVGELAGESVSWRAVNACIYFMPMLDGKALMTVESLGGDHPVQRDMMELHGSQCGFCTPGIVMSLAGRAMGAAGTCGADPRDVLAGNLCRCTGYGPILAAAERNPPRPVEDAALVAALKALRRKERLTLEYDDPQAGLRRSWITPRDLDDLAALRLEKPNARLVAGATDVGLWVTKRHRVLQEIIFVGDLMHGMEETEAGLKLEAGARYVEAHAAMARIHPDLGELVRRIGATQVRNSGAVGANIANGSPIGDTPPALIALDAQLTLRRGAERRTIPLEDYFIEYGKQDLRPGEFVESVFVPRPAPEDVIRIVKLSKRFDSDISAVCMGLRLRMEGERIASARIAFGGMAGTPKRAAQAEAALTGRSLSPESLETAAQALARDFKPLTDMRGSGAYRLEAAGNLLRRLWFERAGPADGLMTQTPVLQPLS